ncbi:phenylalanine--tRNA ligase subunit beta [Candidatus Gracilibacteria bacterium]|nr:phenylalanine--tRNA ligase subunit beta [Candidatus Gracilibacteria bacterium]
MKTPLNWISLYTPLASLLEKQSTIELAHEYSIHTAEIDGIEEHYLDKVIVGKVIACEKHPDSKKLSIVRVNIGNNEEETILTGAPNISEATYVPVALVGAVLGGDFTISDRMMAGMMSRGMICGADEIGLATESDGGIMILENTWDRDLLESQVGKSLFDLSLSFPGMGGKTYIYTLRDTTFEIDNKFITNRPDLFGVYGNAREWHAVFDIPFTEYTPVAQSSNDTPTLPLNIETDRCLAYNAIKMENINVNKSPFGISLMMERAGLAPKMDLVDITNLILTEFGQPMHVFDADKVSGTITVRLAKKGEKMTALNGVEYVLTEEDMVIADNNGPIALAGVIGGMDSAVSETTTNIIWESATFDAVSVRLSAQRHGVRTDASTRYEKSLDPLLASFATSRILDYLEFLGKNIKITRIGSYLDTKQINTPIIDVGYDFINMKAGVEIPKNTIHSILTRLGFSYTYSEDCITVTVPSWRASKDVSIKEDIAEEVIRVFGYDNIPLQTLGANTGISSKNQMKSLKDLSLNFWKHQDWNEVYNYSFTNSSLDESIGYVSMEESVGIQNAFNVEYTHMRRSLSVRLFDNIAKNCNIQNSLRFFEIGKVYSKNKEYTNTVSGFLSNIKETPYGELPMIGGVTTTDSIEILRKSLEAYLIETIGYIPPLHQDKNGTLPFLHPGASGEYREGEIVFVRFGRIHPETAEAFGISPETLYWESDFQILLSHIELKETRVQPISKFQSIPRELSFVMDESIHTGPIAQDIESFHPWISGVYVGSIYRDETKLGTNKKSVNFVFSLCSHEHTITDIEALDIQNNIIETMKEKGCHIRSI